MIPDDAGCGLQHREPLSRGSLGVHFADRLDARAFTQALHALPEGRGRQIQRQPETCGETDHRAWAPSRQRDGGRQGHGAQGEERAPGLREHDDDGEERRASESQHAGGAPTTCTGPERERRPEQQNGMGGEIVRITVDERTDGASEKGVTVEIVDEGRASRKQDVAQQHEHDEKTDLSTCTQGVHGHERYQEDLPVFDERLFDRLWVEGHRIPNESPHRPGDKQPQERRYAKGRALHKQTAQGEDHHDRPDWEAARDDGEQIRQEKDERGRPCDLPGALSRRRLVCADRRHARGPRLRTDLNAHPSGRQQLRNPPTS